MLRDGLCLSAGALIPRSSLVLPVAIADGVTLANPRGLWPHHRPPVSLLSTFRSRCFILVESLWSNCLGRISIFDVSPTFPPTLPS